MSVSPGPRAVFAAAQRALPARGDFAILLLSTVAAALALWQPLPALLLAATAAGAAVLWRWPEAAVYAFVVCMGNVKLNYYFGFFTFFPEYLVLMVAALVWVLRLPESPSPLPETALWRRYGLWMLAGLASITFAPLPARVLARVVLAGMAGFTLLVTLGAVRSRKVLDRVLLLWEATTALMAAYGVAQMVGMAAGVDLSPRFLEKHSNPDMFIGVGSLTVERFKAIFRPNGFFNDPNIFAGYLAMGIVVTLALRLQHAEAGRRRRVAFENVALGFMVLCLLLTISRSGFLALAAGLVVVFSQWGGVLRRGRYWLALGAVLALVYLGAIVLESNPFAIFSRFKDSFQTGDGSNRVHWQAFLFGWKLLARFPFTGVGLGNFSEFYGLEVDVDDRNMMSHCAPLSAFAETGLFGGLAFLALTLWIASRAWSVMRDRALRARDPGMHAIATGVLAALVAFDAANLVYDYYMRTMIWVVSALAVALPRLAARGEDPERA